MTVAQLRRTLEALEAAGRGGHEVAFGDCGGSSAVYDDDAEVVTLDAGGNGDVESL